MKRARQRVDAVHARATRAAHRGVIRYPADATEADKAALVAGANPPGDAFGVLLLPEPLAPTDETIRAWTAAARNYYSNHDCLGSPMKAASDSERAHHSHKSNQQCKTDGG